MLNRLQKEAQCKLLLIQGESFRNIAKTLHMSFSEIGKLNMEVSGGDHNYLKKKKLSKNTKALVLFSKGELPLDVCIQLDMDPEQVKKSYSSFLRLKDLSKLANIIEDPEEKFMESLAFHEFCKKKSIDKDKIVNVMNKYNDISKFNSHHDALIHQEEDIKNRSKKASENLENIQYRIQKAKKDLENLLSNLIKLDDRINQKRKDFSTLVQSINNLKDTDNYKIYEQSLFKIYNKVISKDALKIPLIILALLEVFRDNPIHNQIFSYYYQMFKDGDIQENLKSKQDYIFFKFMPLINDFSTKIQTIYRNKTISDFHHENSSGKSQYQNYF